MLLVEAKELRQLNGQVGSDPQNSQPVAVREFEGRIGQLQFVPESAHSESPAFDVDVMQEDNRAPAEFRQPGIKVPFDGLVGMQAVNVQQVDRSIRKTRQRFVKSGLKQG